MESNKQKPDSSTLTDLKKSLNIKIKSICRLVERLEAGSLPIVKTELDCRLHVLD